MTDLVYTDGYALNSDAMPIETDLELYKGDYVELFVIVKDDDDEPIDLTGYTARASMKLTYNDSNPVDFTCTVTGGIGKVRVYLPSSESANLVPGHYIWDFEIINDDGDSRTYLAGDVTVNAEVTTAG